MAYDAVAVDYDERFRDELDGKPSTASCSTTRSPRDHPA